MNLTEKGEGENMTSTQFATKHQEDLVAEAIKHLADNDMPLMAEAVRGLLARSETAPPVSLAPNSRALANAIVDSMKKNRMPQVTPGDWWFISGALERLADESAPSATRLNVSRSLAERTEAMFRSVDPQGAIAQEWKNVLAE